MKPVAPKPQRCAIYTRKSSEHNLDLEFNSLDALSLWRGDGRYTKPLKADHPQCIHCRIRRWMSL
jgi:hypothetical protein